MSDFLYSILGYWIRREACRLAAQTFRHNEGEGWSPRIWSLVVFYEQYLLEGSNGTSEEFGPTEPTKLEQVKS